MTLTLLGDVFLGMSLTFIADKMGRRHVLIIGSVMMCTGGFAFAISENFIILLLAAIFGVISVTGGDFGPFRAIEESILSQLASKETRSDVLAWYVTTSTLGSAIGSELSGQAIHILVGYGWSHVDAYHMLFWTYFAMGIINAVLVLCLSKNCELQASKEEEAYSMVAQEDQDDSSENEEGDDAQHVTEPGHEQNKRKSWREWLFSRLSRVSQETRAVMYKLWTLLAVDSLADGMVPYSLTNYYMEQKFHPSNATLGNLTSVAYFLGAASSVFAGPIARKIGLVNTMVFTHIPSSAAVLAFPIPTRLWATSALLFLRAGLNNMDQAPRSALIAAIVKPQERTAVLGITTMIRTVASMLGPTLTGLLAGSDEFGAAFVAAGTFRLAYDVGLYVLFKNIEPQATS